MPAMDDSTVMLFPGQGSITSEVALAWTSCDSWRVVDDVSAATGVDVSKFLLDTADEDLIRTDRAQLATFALSLVGWYDFIERRSRPRYLAGHSLGEFSALVAAGILSLEDASRIVSVRGEAMRAASEANAGSMVALMGGDDQALEHLSTINDLWIANVNGTGQLVVSGSIESIERLLATHRELGWRRATALSVGGAFHSPLMSSAQSALDEALNAATWRPTDHLVASNVDGQWRGGGIEWRELLRAQLTSPVQFLSMIELLPDTVTVAMETPPSGVLAGLAKRIREFDAIEQLVAPQTR